MTRTLSLALALALLCAACGSSTVPDPGGSTGDAGNTSDAGTSGAGSDAGTSDAASDAGTSDAGSDAGTSDAGTSDAGSDAGTTITCSAPAIVIDTALAGPGSQPSSCQEPVVSATLPAARVQHLGTHTVGDTVRFTVPSGYAGFSIVSQAVSAQTGDVTFKISGSNYTYPNTVVPLQVFKPSGALFYDDDNQSADPTNDNAMYGVGAAAAGAFTVPNTSGGIAALSGGVTPGTWSFIVADYAYECASFGTAGCASGGSSSGQYDLSVVLQPAPGASPTLDLHVYLVSTYYTASGAAASSKMQRMVSRYAALLATAGLCLGTVTFTDVQPWAKSAYAATINADNTGPCDEFGQLFTLSQAGNAMNLFLVDEIMQGTGGGMGTIVGIDGSIPGPAGFSGTVSSGAIVNVSDLDTVSACSATPNYDLCGPDSVAYIAAHETGHFLGLYHVSESYGDSFDPLSDTPQCTCSTCAPASQQAKCYSNAPSTASPTEVTGAMCTKSASCGGGDNLMFWLLDTTAAGVLSSQQSQVMRLNPLVH
jgi:hypothetical protein